MLLRAPRCSPMLAPMVGEAAPAGESHDVMVGAHTLRLEPPDFYRATYVGDVSGDDALAVARELDRFAQGKAYILGIIDATRMGSTSQEARRAILKMTPLIRGSACLGVSTTLQLVGSIIGRAYRLVHRTVEQPVVYVDTEDEARAWIAERRAVLNAEASAARQ
jgi:hypothetical protein